MATMDLKKNLPKILRGNQFWIDLMEVFEDELNNVKDEIDDKLKFFNTRLLNTVDDLRDINLSLGVYPDLTLFEGKSDDEVLNYLRFETEGISYKVRTKGTYDYYEYIFDRVYRKGDLYLMLRTESDNRLYQAIDNTNTFRKLKNYQISNTFTDIQHFFPYFDASIDEPGFDDEPPLQFDDTPPFTFDAKLIGHSIYVTKHVMLEFFATTTYTSTTTTSTNYLAPKEHFQYLWNAIEYGRRVTNVPHVGLQLCLSTDLSGLYNIQDNIESYTKVTDIFDWTDVYRVQVGNNKEGWFYKKDLIFTEKQSNTSWYLIHSVIPAHRIYPETITNGDGTTTSFSSDDYGALNYSPIAANTVNIYFTHDGVKYSGTDDGQGNISDSENSSITGTIDYTDGTYSIQMFDSGTSTSYAPDLDTAITFEYSTELTLEITKVRVLDSNDNELVYSYFPPIQFDNENNYVSLHFIISKENS